MPTFVRIGRIETNKSKVGSRGWYIVRRHRIVTVTWGAVEVQKTSSSTHFYWAEGWPRTIEHEHGTIADAIEFVRSQVVRITGTSKNGGYQRLPGRTRIRHHR